jgi:hypothetical protein
LRPNGSLVVSLPNVVNISVRLMMLPGKFEYAERGILDRTHVRFYTRASARRMLEDNGFEVRSERMTIIPVELALGMDERNPVVRIVQALLIFFTAIFPGLFGYQIFLIAKRKESRA